MSNYKHLTFQERIRIEELLDKNNSINMISKILGKSRSTIAREITRNRYLVTEASFTLRTCKYSFSCERSHMCGDESCKRNCKGCFDLCNTSKCKDYVPEQCHKIMNAPFVCNGCEKFDNRGSVNCRYFKYKYMAKKAQIAYEDKLTESRSGISFTPSEISEIDNLVSPLLLNGQSVSTIMFNHSNEIPCSERTLYNLVNDCYLTARNIDMPRKVKFKTRYKHGTGRNHDVFTFDRTYADFKRYVEENPNISICEMDTVIGKSDEKPVILTLMFRSCHLMLAFLLPDKSQNSVVDKLNELCDELGIELFKRLFGVILTDRGTEFSNPIALECDYNGEIKTKVFYCDSYCSWQKGMIEKNHELIRYVIPKGTSFLSLSQSDITLLMNHINNYPRASLNNSTPFALAELLLGKKFLDTVHYHKILPDDVILKPMLLDHKNK